jgi:hypothetical protein
MEPLGPPFAGEERVFMVLATGSPAPPPIWCSRRQIGAGRTRFTTKDTKDTKDTKISVFFVSFVVNL